MQTMRQQERIKDRLLHQQKYEMAKARAFQEVNTDEINHNNKLEKERLTSSFPKDMRENKYVTDLVRRRLADFAEQENKRRTSKSDFNTFLKLEENRKNEGQEAFDEFEILLEVIHDKLRADKRDEKEGTFDLNIFADISNLQKKIYSSIYLLNDQQVNRIFIDSKKTFRFIEATSKITEFVSNKGINFIRFLKEYIKRSSGKTLTQRKIIAETLKHEFLTNKFIPKKQEDEIPEFEEYPIIRETPRSPRKTKSKTDTTLTSLLESHSRIPETTKKYSKSPYASPNIFSNLDESETETHTAPVKGKKKSPTTGKKPLPTKHRSIETEIHPPIAQRPPPRTRRYMETTVRSEHVPTPPPQSPNQTRTMHDTVGEDFEEVLKTLGPKSLFPNPTPYAESDESEAEVEEPPREGPKLRPRKKEISEDLKKTLRPQKFLPTDTREEALAKVPYGIKTIKYDGIYYQVPSYFNNRWTLAELTLLYGDIPIIDTETGKKLKIAGNTVRAKAIIKETLYSKHEGSDIED